MVWKLKLRDLLLGCALLAALAGLMVWPEEIISAGKDGLALCGNVILPSLFPFFVVSSLIVGLGLAEYPGRLVEGIMQPLFRVNGNCASALVLGLIGGYPVGARTAAELYKNGQCSRSEAERLLGFCNNSGPAFLLGVVGAGIFGSPRIGLLLMAVHMVSALLVGLIFRFYPADSEAHSAPARTLHLNCNISPATVFTESVRDSCTAVLNVCAFILLFGVILRLLTLSGILGSLSRGLAFFFSPLGLSYPWAKRLLGGFLELSNGVAALPAGDWAGGIPMAAFLLGWGGLSVQCQTMSVLRGTGLSLKPCLVGKLLHGLISAALASLSLKIMPGAVESALLLSQPVYARSLPHWGNVLLLSLLAGGLLLGLCLRLSAENVKKRGGNPRRGKL